MSEFERHVEEATQGDPQAMINLGKAYLEGDGVSSDKLKAASLFCMAVMAGQTSAKALLASTVEGLTAEEIEIAKGYVTEFEYEEEWEGTALIRAQEIFDESTGLLGFRINNMLINLHKGQVLHFGKLMADASEEEKYKISENCWITIKLGLIEYGENFRDKFRSKTINNFQEMLESILILAGLGYKTVVIRSTDGKIISSRFLMPSGQVKELLERPWT